MAIGKDKTRIVLTMPIDIKEKIDQLAKDDNRHTSNYILNILLKHIDQMESNQE